MPGFWQLKSAVKNSPQKSLKINTLTLGYKADTPIRGLKFVLFGEKLVSNEIREIKISGATKRKKAVILNLTQMPPTPNLKQNRQSLLCQLFFGKIEIYIYR